jgi:hypothetical protein
MLLCVNHAMHTITTTTHPPTHTLHTTPPLPIQLCTFWALSTALGALAAVWTLDSQILLTKWVSRPDSTAHTHRKVPIGHLLFYLYIGPFFIAFFFSRCLEVLFFYSCLPDT